MPQKSLETLMQCDFDALTMREQLRLLTAALRTRYTPFRMLFKRELPLCGAQCRDGHLCQARATRDAETGCFVRNGRCRLHGGLSTGPRTSKGKRRIGEAACWRAQRKKAFVGKKGIRL
jgi:hypothetical protein